MGGTLFSTAEHPLRVAKQRGAFFTCCLATQGLRVVLPSDAGLPRDVT